MSYIFSFYKIFNLCNIALLISIRNMPKNFNFYSNIIATLEIDSF